MRRSAFDVYPISDEIGQAGDTTDRLIDVLERHGIDVGIGEDVFNPREGIKVAQGAATPPVQDQSNLPPGHPGYSFFDDGLMLSLPEQVEIELGRRGIEIEK